MLFYTGGELNCDCRIHDQHLYVDRNHVRIWHWEPLRHKLHYWNVQLQHGSVLYGDAKRRISVLRMERRMYWNWCVLVQYDRQPDGDGLLYEHEYAHREFRWHRVRNNLGIELHDRNIRKWDIGDVFCIGSVWLYIRRMERNRRCLYVLRNGSLCIHYLYRSNGNRDIQRDHVYVQPEYHWNRNRYDLRVWMLERNICSRDQLYLYSDSHRRIDICWLDRNRKRLWMHWGHGNVPSHAEC